LVWLADQYSRWSTHSIVVTHQVQVECGTGEVRRPQTDVLPLCNATNRPPITALTLEKKMGQTDEQRQQTIT